MKTTAYILAFLFSAFLVTPTLVSLIEQDADMSYVYNFSEEEENSSSNSGKKHGDQLETKLLPNSEYSLIYSEFDNASLSDRYILNLSIVYFDLLSPPPELA